MGVGCLQVEIILALIHGVLLGTFPAAALIKHEIARDGKGKGANYGWRLREGFISTPSKMAGGPKPPNAVDPIYAYEHGGKPNEGQSVTGGYVYRGPIQSLQGKYFFADYVNPRIWSFEVKNSRMDNFEDWTAGLQPEGGSIQTISSFGEDNDGNLLIISLSGSIYQIVDR